MLVNVFWTAGGQRTLIWASSQPDSGLGVQAPAAAKQVDFVFDRRLDGSRIEDSVNQNGMTVEVSKAVPPITVSWPDGATGTPPFSDQVLYNSEPVYGGSTAYVFLQPSPLGFPSADTITFALDRTALTSAYGEPMIGPDQISIMTAALSATVQLPGGSDAGTLVARTFMIPIAFSNRLSGADAVSPYIHASAGGNAVPLHITASASDPTVVYATAACAAGWPTAAPVTLTVDSRAPDAFGGLLMTPVSATFNASGAGGPGDGGC